MVYNALRDRSILDDLSVSDAILASNIADKRRPLITSFSAKQEYGLPPESPGRPTKEDVTTDGQEGDVDG
jgi:hypothetical protein